MAKYEIIVFGIKGKELVDVDKKTKDQQAALRSGGVVYIYRSTVTKKLYVGQSTQFLTRHKRHYDGTDNR